jgi:hypothetical protein
MNRTRTTSVQKSGACLDNRARELSSPGAAICDRRIVSREEKSRTVKVPQDTIDCAVYSRSGSLQSSYTVMCRPLYETIYAISQPAF